MSTFSTFGSKAIFLYSTIGHFCVNDDQNKTLDILSQKSSSLCLSFQLRKQQHILLKSQTSTPQISLSSYVQSTSKSYIPYPQHAFSIYIYVYIHMYIIHPYICIYTRIYVCVCTYTCIYFSTKSAAIHTCLLFSLFI